MARIYSALGIDIAVDPELAGGELVHFFEGLASHQQYMNKIHAEYNFRPGVAMRGPMEHDPGVT